MLKMAPELTFGVADLNDRKLKMCLELSGEHLLYFHFVHRQAT